MAFNDLFTTFKGLGIIGTVMSLIVVACFIVIGSLALDKRFGGGGETIEYQIAKNQDTIQTLNERLDFFMGKQQDLEKMKLEAEELASVKIALQEIRDRNSAARGTVASMQEGIVETEEMFESYKRRYRGFVREGAIGKKFEELKTLDGKTYTSVEIKSIGALGMNITHRDGSCRISFKELPMDMQKHYQFDEEEAEAQQKREADRRRQHQLALQAADRASTKEKDEAAIQKARQDAVDRAKAINNLEAAIQTLNSRISDLQSKIYMESLKTVSRAPIYKEELQKLEKTRTEYMARIRQLRAAR